MMIAGLVTMNSPLDSYSTANVSFAAFGGDYYTEQYAATKAAVQNTAATANYLEEIGEKLVSCIGLGFLFSGALVSLHHAEFLLSSLKETTNTAESEKNINEKLKEFVLKGTNHNIDSRFKSINEMKEFFKRIINN